MHFLAHQFCCCWEYKIYNEWRIDSEEFQWGWRKITSLEKHILVWKRSMQIYSTLTPFELAFYFYSKSNGFMMSPKRRNIISLLFARLVLIFFLIFVHLNAQKSKEINLTSMLKLSQQIQSPIRRENRNELSCFVTMKSISYISYSVVGSSSSI